MSLRNELSTLTYTNKDFNSIYEELLEYARAISYKWDPTASNESDPGVVLLKLAAIIGDKDNYNIDKNILELMPASVTQPGSAQQIFDQCGYSMSYYRAAEGVVNLTVKKPFSDDDTSPLKTNPNDFLYIVPKFTSFTDSDRITTYTTTEEETLYYAKPTPVNVIEGTPVEYTINGESTIAYYNLDSKHRLYFTDLDVAENGIFIFNKGSTNKETSWFRVDNLSTQPTGTKCYKIGLLPELNTCYIEFPEDSVTLFGEGITLTYIKTKGNSGNIAKDKLCLFQEDKPVIKIVPKTAGSEYTVDASNEPLPASECIHIKNTLPITNGADPETIDSAYKNYNRVKDTFNTLVSLKDYTDYMITSELASNGYVCDRYNDIQHSYKVRCFDNVGNHVKTYTEKKLTTINGQRVEKDKLEAFDLICYGLSFISSVTTAEEYKKSFKLIVPEWNNKQESGDNKPIAENPYPFDLKITQKSEFESVKSLQHNFKGFEQNKILLIKNKYPIKTTIIPRQKVSLTEKYQIEENIRSALYKNLNSKEIYFGDSASYNLIYDTISGADDRIKAITLEFASYQTYVVYIDDNGELKEINITTPEYSEVTATTDNLSSTTFYNKNSDGTYSKVTLDDVTTGEKYYVRSPKYQDFREEIFVKNVLKGVTPLYKSDNDFKYSIAQNNVTKESGIKNFTTSATFNFQEGSSDKTTWTYQLKDNENLLFRSDSFIEENNFSSYVKIIYDLPGATDGSVSANSKYELGDNEFIVFLWKATNEDEDYTYVKYSTAATSPAKIISPSFLLNKEQYRDAPPVFNAIKNFFADSLTRGTTKDQSVTWIEGTGETQKQYTKSVTEIVASMSSSAQDSLEVLTGTKIIKTYKPNSLDLENVSCVWITNRLTTDGKKSVLVLFDEDETEYTLKSNEYFMYTNAERTLLNILGEGTKITRNSSSSQVACDILVYEDVINNDIDYLDTKWHSLTVKITETESLLLGPGTYVTIKTPAADDSVTITSTMTNLNYDVSYSETKDGQSEYLPDIDVSGSGWKCQALLNISCSKDHPQKIESNQSIKIGTNEYSDCWLQTSSDLKSVGNEIDCTRYNGVLLYPDGLSLLLYDYMDGPEDSEETANGTSIKYQYSPQDCNIRLTFNNADSGSSLKVPLVTGSDIFAGSYVLQVISDVKCTNLSLRANFLTTIREITSTGFSSCYKVIHEGEGDLPPTYTFVLPQQLELPDSSFVTDVNFTSNNEMFEQISVSENGIVFYTDGGTTDVPVYYKNAKGQWKFLSEGYKDISFYEDIYQTPSSYTNLITFLEANDASKYTGAFLNFQPENDEPFATVTIQPLYKYTTENLDALSISEGNILRNLRRLDVQGQFDYIGEIESPIENPLLPISFFNKDHFYNKFTICEWEETNKDGTDISVTSNIK